MDGQVIRSRDLIWPVTIVAIVLIIVFAIGIILDDQNNTHVKTECIKSGGTVDYKYGNLVCDNIPQK